MCTMKMLSEGKNRWATRPIAWRCQSNRPWALPKPTRGTLPLDPNQKLPLAPSILRGNPLAGWQVLTVDVRTNQRVQINRTYPLLKFLPLRSSQTFTVDTSPFFLS